ncbi:hypothetical protein J2792_002134 [Novosphingobium capsulatum]|uniref:Uncharacterized protein n=1 Tax=Novosphingobium capsulatum TaxID=13688 RepID=A0ABU1MML3_9SPHN|nr:hypothetical protein [Novosphingobium capsulatum]MDR6511262.1 hypothetical protein [Novosphingobium capsulatum]
MRARTCLSALALLLTTAASAQTIRAQPPGRQATALPRIAAPHGRPALFVDGAPFLVLGAQANNSSNHASVLPQVWQTVEQLGANTLEMPVA